ncbi:uncharacterized protein isoform X1 [Danio rerio]|uniref:Uncharacterized protein isoform X1 n=1 Tax=Danio rerio TaxID=7955 RepID=A0AB32TB84_DANRE
MSDSRCKTEILTVFQLSSECNPRTSEWFKVNTRNLLPIDLMADQCDRDTTSSTLDLEPATTVAEMEEDGVRVELKKTSFPEACENSQSQKKVQLETPINSTSNGEKVKEKKKKKKKSRIASFFRAVGRIFCFTARKEQLSTLSSEPCSDDHENEIYEQRTMVKEEDEEMVEEEEIKKMEEELIEEVEEMMEEVEVIEKEEEMTKNERMEKEENMKMEEEKKKSEEKTDEGWTMVGDERREEIEWPIWKPKPIATVPHIPELGKNQFVVLKISKLKKLQNKQKEEEKRLKEKISRQITVAKFISLKIKEENEKIRLEEEEEKQKKTVNRRVFSTKTLIVKMEEDEKMEVKKVKDDEMEEEDNIEKVKKRRRRRRRNHNMKEEEKKEEEKKKEEEEEKKEKVEKKRRRRPRGNSTKEEEKTDIRKENAEKKWWRNPDPHRSARSHQWPHTRPAPMRRQL